MVNGPGEIFLRESFVSILLVAMWNNKRGVLPLRLFTFFCYLTSGFFPSVDVCIMNILCTCM